MKKHYNLYYLFLEDQKNNPMSEKKKRELEHKIKIFRQRKKTPQTFAYGAENKRRGGNSENEEENAEDP